MVVPASEIIHDRMQALYHPLIGVSPISACGLSALQGLNIQKNSVALFSTILRGRPASSTSATSLNDEKAKAIPGSVGAEL